MDTNAPKWHEHDGVVYFTVTSAGTDGESWLRVFEEDRVNVVDFARDVLMNTKGFVLTDGVTYPVAILRPSALEGVPRVESTLKAEVKRRGLAIPPAEVACLMRNLFSDEELKSIFRTLNCTTITVMHESIEGPEGADIRLQFDFLKGKIWFTGMYVTESSPCGDNDALLFVL